MDNQDPKKKKPLGRDDRSRSFFRTRHEQQAPETTEEQPQKPRREAGAAKPRSQEAAPGKKPYPSKPRREDSAADKKPYAAKPARDSKETDRKPYRATTAGKPRREDSAADRKPYNGKRTDDRPARGSDRYPKKETGYKPRTTPGTPSYGKKKTDDMPSEMRLNRFIAMSGVCSRREADQLIQAGEVSVNGQVVDQLGTKIHITDEIRLNGQLLRGEKKVYILMNKPKGYVTTVEDPHADRTVIDLLKGKCKERVYPVGRLDKNTTGVLLLTNDGDLTKELTHPSFEKKKIYHVFLDKPCTEADLEKLAAGIELEDGPIHADEVSFVANNPKEVGIELHSGRNRIVRRMFEHLGYDVIKLDRVYFAGLTKSALRRGFWRYLTTSEVSALKSGSYQ